MNHKVKRTLFIAAFIIMVIAIIVGMTLIKKYTPSDQVMDIEEYYQVEENEALIIFQNGIYEKKALYEDGEVYLDYETIIEFINKRFYWDNNENLLIYTTPTELIKTPIGSNDYSVNKNNDSFGYPITKTKDGILYIAVDFIDLYSDMQYDFYESPNRILIQNDWGEYLFSTVEKNTQLRILDDIKSDILLELDKGTKLNFVDNEIIYDNDFSKVMTSDGIIGFVRNKNTSDSYYDKIESSYVEPEYVQTKKNTPINLVWHQVTNQSANNNLLSDLEGTKGLTIISPTWYSIIGNDGTISSLASETYVERAHSQGLEVWGLVDDFNPEIDIVRVLSYSSSREKLINELIASAIKYNLDGINIDFETLPQPGGKHFIQFIRELSIRCRSNGIVLSIDNYVPREYSSYYDLKEQGIVADYVIIMAYDEHHSTSEISGSVASIGFVEDAIKRTLDMVPKEKTIIGIPFYSRLWQEDHSDIVETWALAMTNAQTTFEVNGVEAQWDPTTGQYYGEYEKEGYIYKMWLEEEDSIDLKMQAISKSNVAGVASWKLGLEKQEVWNVINKYLN